jgi:serralysin
VRFGRLVPAKAFRIAEIHRADRLARASRPRRNSPNPVLQGTARELHGWHARPVETGATRAQPEETIMVNVTGWGFNGTPGVDNFTGGAGSDDSFEMTANDYVTDHIDGRGGTDLIDYSRSSIGVTITLTDPDSDGDTGGSVTADFRISFTNPATDQTVVVGNVQTVAELANIENANGSNFNDVIRGNSGANTLNGLDGNDVISGGGGNDIIDGGRGDDRIIGGAGRDLLTGGADHDTFVFAHVSDSPAGTYDTITDFVHGDDKIDLSGLVKETTGNHALQFIDDHAFTGTAGQVNAIAAGDGYMVQVDVDGDRRADLAVEVHTAAPLHANDLTLA